MTRLAVLACFVVALLPRSAAAQPPAHLRLTETFAHPLPDTLQIGSIAVGGPDELLAWAPNQDVVLRLVRGEQRALGVGHLQLPVGAAFVDGGYEVVDAQRRGVVSFAADGSERGFRPIASTGALRNAVRTPAGWFVGVNSSAEGYVLLRLMGDSARVLARLSADTAANAPLREAQLAPDGDGVLMTDVRAPFTTLRVATDGRVLGTLQPGLPAAGAAGAKWIPLPALALGDGFVQVFADLASDLRDLVVFDAEGRVLRRTRVEVPLAFVASVPSLRLLVGSRAIGARELVGYRWEWEREGSP
ncbi:MAG TPA: hypothetical protein VM890_07185 [Longimicrobium sp.]|jgi:hypothetical protein|nr:hypothetical protein [Longimicrobium sp.]